MKLFRANTNKLKHLLINVVFFKNPNWQEADQLATYKAEQKSWIWDNCEKNPVTIKV